MIDVNPPLLTGDRAFDLATLLFYLYDHDDIRHVLGTRLLELSSWQGTGQALVADITAEPRH